MAPESDDGDAADDWYAGETRVEIRGTITDRGADLLREWFGDKRVVKNEQDAWLYLVDEYAAQLEASGMPPDIAEDLNAMLADGGGMLLSPGDGGFVLVKPDRSGLRFGVGEDDDGHRVMHFEELSPDEMADAMAGVEQAALVDLLVELGTKREDLDPAAGLVDVWAGLNDRAGLSLAAVFRNAIERGICSPAELQAAVDDAT